MCLGIPGRVLTVWDTPDGTRLADVEFPDRVATVCLAFLPDLAAGDYTIAHAGFALTKLDEEDAAQTLATMREYGVLS